MEAGCSWQRSGSRSAGPSTALACCSIALILMLPSVARGATIASAPQDSRCYLKGGGSSASFTVTELLPTGGVIGTLEVGGEVGERGDIQLSLPENKLGSKMVEIAADSKRLVLTGKLDKEAVDGASHLHFQVKCEKKNSNDPAIVIPVRVVVQDANDNAPVFVNAPYILQLSEAMTAGMVISSDTIKAFDRDQPGPFSTVQYSVEPGPSSSFLAFQSALAPTLVIKRQLDFETLPNFTVTIRAQDQGHPPLYNTTTLTIKVLDADDQNPRFLDESYVAILPKTNNPGDQLKIEPGPIRAVDQDKGLNVPVYYSFDKETADSGYFHIDNRTGSVSLRSSIPSDMAFPVTLVIKSAQIDNEDRRDLTTLLVARNELHGGLKFLSPLYHLSVPENLPNNSILLRLQTNRPYDEFLSFSLKSTEDGQFKITQSGDLVLQKPLDYEKMSQAELEVQVSSGSMSDVTKIELDVLDVNEHDPKFDRSNFRFLVTAMSIKKKQPIGRIGATDADRDDKVKLELVGANYSAFQLDKDGQVFVANVSRLNSSSTHLVVVATDSGVPPRKTSVALEVLAPEELLAIGSLTTSGVLSVDSTFFLMIIFGVSLGILFIVIIVLAIHIAKRKRQQERVGPTYPNHQPISKMASYMGGAVGPNSFAHRKLASSGGDSGNSSSDTENNTTANNTPPTAPHILPPGGAHHRKRRGVENPIYADSPPAVPRRLTNNGAMPVPIPHVPHLLRHNGTSHVHHSSSYAVGSSRGGGGGSTSSTDVDSVDGGGQGALIEDSDEDNDRSERNNQCHVISVRCVHRQPRETLSPVCNCVTPPRGGDDEFENDEEDEEDDLEHGQHTCGGEFERVRNGRAGAKRSSMKVRGVGGGSVAGPTPLDTNIPKRVKKLSWEDEQGNNRCMELDPEVSVAPFLSKHSKNMDHPDLTVYF